MRPSTIVRISRGAARTVWRGDPSTIRRARHKPDRVPSAPPPLTQPLPDALTAAADELILVSGEEALSRIAMMQFSLQFMLWQQHRRRWEGIVASAVAHIEGFSDLDCLSSASRMTGHQQATQDWDAHDAAMSRDVKYIAAMGAAPLVPAAARDLAVVVLPHRPRDVASTVTNGAQEKQALTSVAEGPPPHAMHSPPLCSADTAPAVPLPLTPSPSDPGLELPASPTTSTTQVVMSAAPRDVPCTLESHHADIEQNHSATSSKHAGVPLPSLVPQSMCSLVFHRLPASPTQAADFTTFVVKLEMLLYCGAPLRADDGRRIVERLLSLPGGYAELKRKNALFLCELGLHRHINKRTKRWRAEQQALTPEPEIPHAATPIIIGAAGSSKHVVNALLAVMQWNRDAIAIFTRLVSLDPGIALRQLPHLCTRFGAKTIYATPVVQELLREAEDDGSAPSTRGATSPCTVAVDHKKPSKFGRAIQRITAQ
jgi:hypothetical protein